MDFTQEIARFVTGAIGGIYIVDEQTRQIVYADPFVERLYGPGLVGRSAAAALPWEARSLHAPLSRTTAAEWECVDRDRQLHWRLHHALFDKDGGVYKIGQLTNTTDYMLLSQEVAEYSVLSSKVADFQSAMLAKISAPASALLPIIAGFFKAPRLFFLVARKGRLETLVFDAATATCTRGRRPLAPAHDPALAGPAGVELAPGHLPPVLRELAGPAARPGHRLCAGTFADQRYALVLEIGDRTDRKALDIEIIAVSVALCVENNLLREEIVYESEHDQLTGLNNKGKYLARLAADYPALDSIGILNFDVNYLKQTNDTHGHEAGDRLLVKAGASLLPLASDTVHAYRLGGDEYLVIACNPAPGDLDTLRERWEASLAELNQAPGDVPCSMACGAAFATAPFDFPQVMKLADERMYADKRLKKKPGEEIR
jgi:diguanylate cyclase (GGDEF)-like protein